MKILYKALAVLTASLLTLTLTSCRTLPIGPDKTPLVYRVNTVLNGMDTMFPSHPRPIVWNHLLIGSAGTELAAYDLNDGSLRWRQDLGQPFYFKLRGDEVLTWPLIDQDTNLTGLKVNLLDAASGQVDESLDLSAPADVLRSLHPESMVINGNDVYIGATRGVIHTFQLGSDSVTLANTAHIDEIYDISGYNDHPEHFYIYNMLREPESGDLFVAVSAPYYSDSGWHSLFRVNPATGAVVWAGSASAADMLLVGDSLFLGAYSEARAVDPASGEERWYYRFYSDASVDPGSLIYDPALPAVVAPFGVIKLVGQGIEVWNISDVYAFVSECYNYPALLDGVVYYAGHSGLLAFDESSGALLSSHIFDDSPYLRLDGYAFSDEGRIYVLLDNELSAYLPVGNHN